MLLSNPLFAKLKFPLRRYDGLLAELNERCELEALNPLPMAAVNVGCGPFKLIELFATFRGPLNKT